MNASSRMVTAVIAGSASFPADSPRCSWRATPRACALSHHVQSCLSLLQLPRQPSILGLQLHRPGRRRRPARPALAVPPIRSARSGRVTGLGPLSDLRLVDPLTTQHRGLLTMRSSFILGQNTGTIIRRKRPPRRLRSRINTAHRRLWDLSIHHDYVRSPPSFRKPHNDRGVSPQPDREGRATRPSRTHSAKRHTGRAFACPHQHGAAANQHHTTTGTHQNPSAHTMPRTRHDSGPPGSWWSVALMSQRRDSRLKCAGWTRTGSTSRHRVRVGRVRLSKFPRAADAAER